MKKNSFKIFKKKSNQSSRGITLIALIISIIVLLILAGVSISTLAGENGLLTKANQAKVENEKAGERDLIQLAYQAAKMEEYQNTDSSKTFADFLKTELEVNGLTGATLIDNGDGSYTVISENGNEYNVEENRAITNGRQEDTSGANPPELWDGMQAITFASNGTETVVTDSNKKDWYNYRVTEDNDMTDGGTTEGGKSKWANAKLNGNYYVWIPRYAYKIDTSVTYTSQSGTSKKIDVKFIGTDVTQANIGEKLGASYADYIVHPAFTFGTVGETTTPNELSGIWVGKYETSGGTTEEDLPTILPNVPSLRSINVSTMFSTARLLTTTKYDAHMMKNIEWGAVAYLAQSQYGRNGTEISVNQCTGYITGAGKTEGSNKIYESTTYSTPTAAQQYNGKVGKLSSTTGNIYGVYDMAGGAWEYVMGFYQDSDGNIHTGNSSTNNSGFNGYLNDGSQKEDGIDLPNEKYYELCTSINADNSKKGSALFETSGWNSDNANFVDSYSPVFRRGGYYDYTSSAGAFSFNDGDGGGYSNDSFRVCLAVK